MNIQNAGLDDAPSTFQVVFRGRQNAAPVPAFASSPRAREYRTGNRWGGPAIDGQAPCSLQNLASQLSAVQPEDLRSHLQIPEEPSIQSLTLADPACYNAMVEPLPPTPVSRTMSLPLSLGAAALSGGAAKGASFSYRKLGISEIRLLRLHPGTGRRLECEVTHSFLLDHPDYISLSYAWGDADDTNNVKVDGQDVAITSSLYGALMAVRHPTEIIHVWADALCINQQDKEELSQQVKLMTFIYESAVNVSIWLGPGADQTALAVELLGAVAYWADSSAAMTSVIASETLRPHFAALVALFDRDYWRRLWVVQEVISARSIMVYCGDQKIQWPAFIAAIKAFKRHSSDLENYFPTGVIDDMSFDDGGYGNISRPLLSVSQILCTQGPANFHDLYRRRNMGPESLLEVLHACRTKLAANPRDKVFGLLGILSDEVRRVFPIDYRVSVKEVYINVVHFLLQSTKRLDVICEAIHFPLHTSLHNLPSWAPDWSQVSQIGALGLSYDFSASGQTKADAFFPDPPRRSKLQFTAIQMDTIMARGITVGTLGTLEDLLMAFLHWRAKLFAAKQPPVPSPMIGSGQPLPQPPFTLDDETHEAFCRTLCLGQATAATPGQWRDVCYHVFASLIRERLPHLILDAELARYADVGPQLGVAPEDRRHIIQKNCKPRMMGRCFFVTRAGLMGLGSGFMNPDDEICVPFGCGTPVLLRTEGSRYHRYVGDAYVDGFMTGRAMEMYRDGQLQKRSYVLQ